MKSDGEFTLPLPRELNILLADDDKDDCLIFEEALKELPLSAHLTTVHNGEQLMQYLQQTSALPAVLFLDLNMPRKSGFTCLDEIKRNQQLKTLPVIILSTSFDQSKAELYFKSGALRFISKPADFYQFKNLIHLALNLIAEGHISQPPKENFVLTAG